MNGTRDGIARLSLHDGPVPSQAPPLEAQASRAPFGGVAMPGMVPPPTPPTPAHELPDRRSSMPPPPQPPAMIMPEPRVSSRQSNNYEEDPMAKALADLRRDPPPSESIRRAPSARSSIRSGVQSPPSPAPQHRMSYQQSPAAVTKSPDMTLSPPAAGHTAAALQKSMDDFKQQSYRPPMDGKRSSVNYDNFAADVVGAHPSSRPGTPSGQPPRGPSPAMMQAPRQPASPINDEVLSQYHQAFPGERQTRSRAGSVNSAHSGQAQPIGSQIAQGTAQSPREGFVGIGAGGRRSPSPQPFNRAPSPAPQGHGGVLGPQNLGIALDKTGAVSQDTMAEQYRRQYQQQHQQGQPIMGSVPSQPSTYAQSPQQYGQASQPVGYGGLGKPPMQQQQASSSGRPPSTYGAPSQQQPTVSQQSYNQQSHGQQYRPPQQAAQSYSGYTAPSAGYHPPAQSAQASQQANGYARPPNQALYGQPAQSAYQSPPYQSTTQIPQAQAYRSPSPQPQQSHVLQNPQYTQQQQRQQSQQQQQQTPFASPAAQYPAQQQQQPRAPSPAGYQQGPPPQSSPTPQPNMPPKDATPTGQWSTGGLPVLFCE